ncbi:MAG: hypothetical protein ACI9HI_000973 [Salinirussus sp.]|jgi:hypothetical protein
MSDEGRDDETTVISAGVSVTKRLEPEEFEDPIIAFDIESRRDGSATVTVVDSLPERVSPRDLRFHPEYGSEHWVIDDGELIFEREFDPGEGYVTLYRLCETEDNSVGVSEDPTVHVEPDTEVTPGATKPRGTVRSAGSAAGTEGGRRVPAEDRSTTVVTDTTGEASRDGDTNSSGGAPGHDVPGEGQDNTPSEGEAEEGESSIPRDGRMGRLGAGEDDAPDGEHDTPGTAHGAGVEPAEGSLVAALATELEEGTVPAGDVERLRVALGRQRDSPQGVAVRVERLRRDVDEMLAYTDALAEFQAEAEDFHEERERLKTDLEAARTTADRVEGRVGDIEAALSDGFGDMQEVETLCEEGRDLHGERESTSTDDRISKLEQDVRELQEWRGRLATVFQELDS